MAFIDLIFLLSFQYYQQPELVWHAWVWTYIFFYSPDTSFSLPLCFHSTWRYFDAAEFESKLERKWLLLQQREKEKNGERRKTRRKSWKCLEWPIAGMAPVVKRISEIPDIVFLNSSIYMVVVVPTVIREKIGFVFPQYLVKLFILLESHSNGHEFSDSQLFQLKIRYVLQLIYLALTQAWFLNGGCWDNLSSSHPRLQTLSSWETERIWVPTRSKCILEDLKKRNEWGKKIKEWERSQGKRRRKKNNTNFERLRSANANFSPTKENERKLAEKWGRIHFFYTSQTFKAGSDFFGVERKEGRTYSQSK